MRSRLFVGGMRVSLATLPAGQIRPCTVLVAVLALAACTGGTAPPGAAGSDR